MGEHARDALVACGRGEIGLSEALETFVQSSRALAAGLTLWKDGAFVQQTWVGLPSEFERGYVAQFHAEDPWIRGVRAVAIGTIVVSDTLVPRDILERSAFHAELCRPSRIKDIYGGRLARDGSYEVTIGVLRSVDARGRGAREAVDLAGLVPELGTIAESEIGAFRASILDTSLDRLPFGVFVIDAGTAEVLLTNTAARALAATGTVELRPREIVVDGESLGAWLSSLPYGRRTTRQRSVRVSVFPPRMARGVRVRDLYVHDARAVSHELAERARNAYGLSEREAQIACHLLLGDSPKEIARKNGVSISTMRSQLRNLYAKVGVPGQAQLVGALSIG